MKRVMLFVLVAVMVLSVAVCAESELKLALAPTILISPLNNSGGVMIGGIVLENSDGDPWLRVEAGFVGGTKTHIVPRLTVDFSLAYLDDAIIYLGGGLEIVYNTYPGQNFTGLVIEGGVLIRQEVVEETTGFDLLGADFLKLLVGGTIPVGYPGFILTIGFGLEWLF